MRVSERLACAITALALCAAPSVSIAQGRGPGGGFGFRQGFMSAGMRMGREHTPNPLGMLMRPDVQTEIQLDLRQKNAIGEAMQGAVLERREQMRQQFQGQDFQSLRNLSPDERRERAQQMRERMQPIMEQMMNTAGELPDAVKALLKPQQIKRLTQLDYQYRGALALANPKTAEELKLAAMTRAEIQKLATEYQAQIAEARRAFFESMRTAPGERPQRPTGNPFMELDNPLSPTRQKMDKAKKETESAVLALLTAEEMQRWTEALGEKFTFRKDVPLQRGPRGNV